MIGKRLLVLDLCLVLFVLPLGAIAEKLEKDTVIQGIKCVKRGIEFHESGKLKLARLSQDQKIQGMKLPKDTSIYFYKSGKLKLARLSQDQKIQGIKCAKKYLVRFHESGKLEKVHLSQDQEIQGIKCAKGDVRFRESGKIRDADIFQDQEIQGIKCTKGDWVCFDESGELEYIRFFQEHKTRSVEELKSFLMKKGK